MLGSIPTARMAMSTAILRTAPRSVSSTRMMSFPSSFSVRARALGDFGHSAADEFRPLFEQAVIEFFVPFAEAAHIDIKVIDRSLGFFAEKMGELQGVHAANAGTIGVVVFVS